MRDLNSVYRSMVSKSTGGASSILMLSSPAGGADAVRWREVAVVVSLGLTVVAGGGGGGGGGGATNTGGLLDTSTTLFGGAAGGADGTGVVTVGGGDAATDDGAVGDKLTTRTCVDGVCWRKWLNCVNWCVG